MFVERKTLHSSRKIENSKGFTNIHYHCIILGRSFQPCPHGPKLVASNVCFTIVPNTLVQDVDCFGWWDVWFWQGWLVSLKNSNLLSYL